MPLLSTATGFFALTSTGHGIPGDAAKHREFLESVWHHSGGFCATLMDDQPDCEYTFYGLLAVGCLA